MHTSEKYLALMLNNLHIFFHLKVKLHALSTWKALPNRHIKENALSIVCSKL